MTASTLEAAFGPSSLGIVIVTDLPPEFNTLRERLLTLASYLAQLPAVTLDTLVCPRAKYLTGWSHGVETLKPGVFDTQKGSFYVNCGQFLRPGQDDPVEDFPEYTAPNVWPPEGALPGFHAATEELCALIVSVASLVARACDHYAENHIPGYDPGYLESMVHTSATTKARLLHYFPPSADKIRDGADEASDEEDDSWCTTHVDHGCLTGLTSALYVDESEPLPELPPSAPVPAVPVLAEAPDKKAGLYIRSRTGETTKVAIPPKGLAFQTGEALERVTEGRFRAVPHFVRSGGTGMEGVARNTLAVFTQPSLDAIVDRQRNLTFRDFSMEVVARHRREGP